MTIPNYVQFVRQSRSILEKVNTDNMFDRPASKQYLKDVSKFIFEKYGRSAWDECNNDLDLQFEMYSSPFCRLMMNRIDRLMQRVYTFEERLSDDS